MARWHSGQIDVDVRRHRPSHERREVLDGEPQRPQQWRLREMHLTSALAAQSQRQPRDFENTKRGGYSFNEHASASYMPRVGADPKRAAESVLTEFALDNRTSHAVDYWRALGSCADTQDELDAYLVTLRCRGKNIEELPRQLIDRCGLASQRQHARPWHMHRGGSHQRVAIVVCLVVTQSDSR